MIHIYILIRNAFSIEIPISIIETFIHLYEEIPEKKEFLNIFISTLVFFLIYKYSAKKNNNEVLVYISLYIGIAGIFIGDIGYWNDNDMLKFLAPGIFLLLFRRSTTDSSLPLFLFLTPYCITSYEFYRSNYYALGSLAAHLYIILCIIFSKTNLLLTVFVSIIIGFLINYLGDISSPGTNDIFVNPTLITLIVIGLEHLTKNRLYSHFLRYFWITLMGFAYFGNWVFYFAQPFFPVYRDFVQ